jgi:DNA-binding response OmpR family regulator
VFDVETNTLKTSDETIKLTTKESNLLQMLVESKNELVSRENLLERVWGANTYFNGRSMDVYITKLRKYLKGEDGVEIMNHHGIGFKLMTP